MTCQSFAFNPLKCKSSHPNLNSTLEFVGKTDLFGKKWGVFDVCQGESWSFLIGMSWENNRKKTYMLEKQRIYASVEMLCHSYVVTTKSSEALWPNPRSNLTYTSVEQLRWLTCSVPAIAPVYFCLFFCCTLWIHQWDNKNHILNV